MPSTHFPLRSKMEKAEFQLFSGAGRPTSKRKSTRHPCSRITPAVTGTQCTDETIATTAKGILAAVPDLETAKITAGIGTATTAENAIAIGT